MAFHGSIPALITPFREGVLDLKAFANLVEWHIAEGSSALVPCGTTGEASTLSHDEHRQVIARCINVAAGRVPVIAGCGSNSTAEAIELMTFAKQVGADAALVVCPYYNRPDQAGLYKHFKALNDRVALPFFLYNVPGRTVCDMSVETVIALSRLPNIIGLKDASADLSRLSQHKLETDEGFILLSGEDSSALAFSAAGGHGCISVTANLAPRSCADMQSAIAKGDLPTAQAIEAKLYKLHQALFLSPSPGPAKYGASRLGLCAPELRAPLYAPDETIQAIIDDAMQHAGLI